MLQSAKRGLFIVGLLAWVIGPRFNASAQDSNTFFADLAFHFDCQNHLPHLESSIERFLKQRLPGDERCPGGSRRNLAPMPQSLFIDGIDDDQRHIRIRASAVVVNSYSVGLYTRPPTKRAVSLEESLLKFVTNEIGC